MSEFSKHPFAVHVTDTDDFRRNSIPRQQHWVPLQQQYLPQQQIPPAPKVNSLINLPAVQHHVSLGNQGPVYSNVVQGTKEFGQAPKIFDGQDKSMDYEWWKDEIHGNTQFFSTY